jgi:hypothetical protein
MGPPAARELPQARDVEDDVLVADEVRRAPVATDDLRDEQERIHDVEDVVSHQHDPPLRADQSPQPVEVMHLMPMVAGEQGRTAEEEPRHELVWVHRHAGHARSLRPRPSLPRGGGGLE